MKEFILFILIGHKTKDKVNRGNDMVSTDKFAATVIILLLLSILFTGAPTTPNPKYGTRVRISFMDNYPHVKARFQAAGREPLEYSFHAPLASRMEMASFFPGAEICGEPGMECTGCVSERDLRTLGIEPPRSPWADSRDRNVNAWL